MNKFFLVLFLSLFALTSRSAQIVFAHTNSLGQPDTNRFLVVPVGAPSTTTGGIVTRSYPFWLTPASDGRLTNFLSQGHYFITNSFLTPGYVIRVPDDAGNTLYYAWQKSPTVLVSGLGIFVTITNDGTAAVVTYNAITNSLGFTPANSNTLVTLQNLEASDFLLLSNRDLSFSNSMLSLLNSSVATVGLNGTNYSKSVGANDTNFSLSIGLNGTNYANSVGSLLTNLANAIGLNGTNYTKSVGQLLTNLVATFGANGTNFSQLVGTSLSNLLTLQISFATNYANTNTAAQIAGLFLGNTDGLPSVLSTNYLGLSLSGAVQANGTYAWSGSAYTNNSYSSLYVTNISGTWYVLSNAVTLYSGSSPTNTATLVSGSPPAPTSAWGYIINNNGNVYTGSAINTNVIALINSAVSSQASLQTNDTRSQGALETNYVNSVGQMLTNLVFLIGANDTNFTKSIGLNDTNFSKSIGLNGTNYANSVGLSLSNLLSGFVDSTNGEIWNVTFLDQDGNSQPISAYNGSGTLHIGGTVLADNFTGAGAGLTSVPASSLIGILSSANLTSPMRPLFTNNAVNLTNLQAGQLVGSISDARLSSNVTLKDGQNNFTGSNYVANSLRVLSNLYGGIIFGSASGLTNIPGGQIQTGTVSSNAFDTATSNLLFFARAFGGLSVTNITNYGSTIYMPGMSGSSAALLMLNPNTGGSANQAYTLSANGNANSYLNGNLAFSSSIDSSMLPSAIQSLNSGNGGALTNMSASALVIGTLATARLPSKFTAFDQYWDTASGLLKGGTGIWLTNGSLSVPGGVSGGIEINGTTPGTDGATIWTTPAQFQIVDFRSGGNIPMLYFSMGTSLLHSTNFQVHGSLTTDSAYVPTNTAPVVEDTNAPTLNTLYTNTAQRVYFSLTVTNSGAAGYVALVCNRGNGWLTNSTVNGFGTLSTILGPNDAYCISNWSGTWVINGSQKLKL